MFFSCVNVYQRISNIIPPIFHLYVPNVPMILKMWDHLGSHHGTHILPNTYHIYIYIYDICTIWNMICIHTYNIYYVIVHILVITHTNTIPPISSCSHVSRLRAPENVSWNASALKMWRPGPRSTARQPGGPWPGHWVWLTDL